MSNDEQCGGSGNSERADDARFRGRLPRSSVPVAGWFETAPWRWDAIVESNRVGSCDELPPSMEPLSKSPFDEGNFDLRAPEFAELPVAFAGAAR